MSGQILPGVPESITRKAYLALIESLGLETKDLRSLEFKHNAIYAEVIARDEHGDRYAVGDEIATHRVCVKVVDEAGGPA